MATPVLQIILWVCLGAVAYNYVGYPVVLFVLSSVFQMKSDLLYLIRRKTRRCTSPVDYVPNVALLISAYNEEAVIGAKVKNTLELNYPRERLEVLFGLDAPTDSTAEVLNQFEMGQFQTFHFSTRRGKLAVLRELARRTSADILIFTDANTMLERSCIRNLVRHFADPSVGAVSGEEVRMVAPGTDPAAESLYWRYESALKVLESRLNCLQGGNGAALAVRRTLFNPRRESIVEDFQIPLEIRFNGHRVVYDPEAIAVEEITPGFSAQFARRIRIGAGNYQTLFANPGYLKPSKTLLTFSFFSHRVLRWLTPVLLPVAFACNVMLTMQSQFAMLLIMQSAFYMMAVSGYWLKKRSRSLGLLAVPFHFCLMNLALLLGLVAYLRGKQSAVWKSTPRQMPVEILSLKGDN